MKKLFFFTLLFLPSFFFSQNIIQAQTLFTISGKPVNVSEFEYIYKKNNINNKADYSKASLNEYLNLFENFKLKVTEAESLGMDKDQELMDEYASYENQLFDAYLDKEITDSLVKEAFNRTQKDVSISDIYFPFSPDNAESASAMKKMADQVYDLLQKGGKFEELAKTYSQDKSSADQGGYLGFFTGLQIADKNLEDAAFSLQPGQFSKPIKSSTGFHIVKVNEVRTARGKIKVAIIKKMIPIYDSLQPVVKARMDSIYLALKSGADFGELAKTISDDQFSSYKGGELEWFGISQYNPLFEDKAFGLQKDGDFSEPFKTKTAWYIVKRLEKAANPTFEDSKPILYAKIKKSDRYTNERIDYADKIGKKEGLKTDEVNLASFKDKVIKAFETMPFAYEPVGAPKTIVTIKDKVIDENALGEVIEGNFRFAQGISGAAKFDQLYKISLSDLILENLEKILPAENKEYGSLLKEYRDGILLFQLMQNNVWSKAMEDTTGLQEYFKNNREQFKWNDRANVSVFTFPDAKSAALVKKYTKQDKNMKDSTLFAKFTMSGIEGINLSPATYEKNVTEGWSNFLWMVGYSKPVFVNGKYTVYKVNNITPSKEKSFDETKGYVVAAYQEYLEKQWLVELRKKYPIVLDQQVFDSLVKK